MFADAVESNVAEFLMAMGAVGGGDQRDDGEISWTVGGSPIDYHNAVVACTADDVSRASELAQEFVEALRARGVPGTWHHHPRMSPPGLIEMLIDAGFTDGGSEPAMALSLDRLAATSTSAPAMFDVIDDAGLRAYRDVLADGFGEGPREADWVCSIWKRIGLAQPSPWRHYVTTAGTEPASAATVYRTGDTAGVYFVATRPRFRRRGYGTAITARALDRARADGADVAVLGSSPMGQRIYERLGFREVFAYRILEWRP